MENNTIAGKISTKDKDTVPVSGQTKYKKDVLNKSTDSLKSIHMSGDRFIIREESSVRSYQGNKTQDKELPGVFIKGTQYYDLKDIYFINNTGIANLIDLLKSLLENDVEVRFVNVSDKIKQKIRSMGLDHILICS